MNHASVSGRRDPAGFFPDEKTMKKAGDKKRPWLKRLDSLTVEL